MDQQTPDEGITFRSRFGIVLTLAVWAISAAAIVSSIVADAGITPVVLLATLSWFVWLAFWRPSVVCRADEVEFRNLLRDVTIPYGAIDSVDTRFSLSVRADEHTYSAWAAPAPSGRSAMRIRRGDEHGRDLPRDLRESRVRAGDLTSSVSGAPATVIRREIEKLEGRRAVGATVSVRWDPVLVGVSATLVAASVAAVILG